MTKNIRQLQSSKNQNVEKEKLKDIAKNEYLVAIKKFYFFSSLTYFRTRQPFIFHHSFKKIMRLDKVKNLISNGKTQQALDLLQELLKDKDNTLLNQTFLLESQLKELQRKMQLGLQDATEEVNRINFTLLSLCDEASNLDDMDDDATEKPFSDEEKPKGLLANPLAIFGIIVAIAIATVLGIFLLGKKTTVVQPLPLPIVEQVNSKIAWSSTPQTATILERYYGNVKANILSIVATTKDVNTKILTLEIEFNCLKSSSGACIVNYLKFQLIDSIGNKNEPFEDVYFAENPKDGQKATAKIAFVIPNTLKETDFNIYYTGKLEKTLVTLKLKTQNE